MQELIYTNSAGQSVTIGGAPPYVLNDFDPGGPKTTMITTKAPGQDGKTLVDELMEERTPQITLTIDAEDVESLYILRRALYSALNPKLGGTLTYTNDAGTQTIACRPQDAPAEKARVGASQQILIQFFCPEPFWLGDPQTIQIAQWVGDLEFPFDVPPEGTEWGHRASDLIIDAYNGGDVPCGVRIEFTALADVQSPSILNIYTKEIMRVWQTLSAGDKLIVNTGFGNETVQLQRGRVLSNAMNYIDLSSDFFQLSPGDNYLRYNADAGLDNLECAIYFTPKYLGA